MLLREYDEPVRHAAVIVTREPYGYHFPDLFTVQEADEYVKKEGRVLNKA